jgi:Neuraminidase (sialidase)
MFNEKKGVIIWELEKGQLVYSTTNDGGINWEQQSFKSYKIKEQQIQHIRFSASGEITLVLSNLFVFETDREESLIFKSTNFGKSFKILD